VREYLAVGVDRGLLQRSIDRGLQHSKARLAVQNVTSRKSLGAVIARAALSCALRDVIGFEPLCKGGCTGLHEEAEHSVE